MKCRSATLVPDRLAYGGLAPLPIASPMGGEKCIRLHLSESMIGPSPRARAALHEQGRRAGRYPDATAGSLIAAIADMHQVQPAAVVVGNGIDELLLFTALAFVGAGGAGIFCAQTFPGHRSALEVVRGAPREVPLSANRIDAERLADEMRSGASAAYVCNPHNPTGSALSAEELAFLVDQACETGTLLVVDEAYMEYAEPDLATSAIDYVRQGAPVVVLRTFSKIFGLAGLRCGYSIAPEPYSSHLRKLKHVTVFNVNRLALAAAEASIRDRDFVAYVRGETRRALRSFLGDIGALAWLRPMPSVTNFVLLGTPWAATDVAAVLRRRGILVRPCADLGFPLHVRLSMGAPAHLSAAVLGLAAASQDLRHADGAVDRWV